MKTVIQIDQYCELYIIEQAAAPAICNEGTEIRNV
jgi:hypothetical protein